MKKYLNKQVDERQEKEIIEKKLANEQADMWAKDKVNYE
jgi:hypothetical protein